MSNASDRNTPPEELRRSRDQLEIILRGVTDGITAQDASGRLVFANAAAVKTLGFDTMDELLAASPDAILSRFEMMDEEGKPFPPSMLPSRLALAGGQPPEVLIRFRMRDGTADRWSEITSNAVLDPDGKVDRVINIFRDVTDRKRADDAVRVGHEWFATTLRSIGDAVIATDERGRITFMNAVAEELTGWSVDEARGEGLARVFAIVNERTRIEVESPVTKVLREGVVVGLANHTILVKKGGGEVAIDDSGAPIRNAKGDLVGVVLVFRDVTEKRREEERRLFIAEASHVLASSLDFSTTLATVARLAVPHVADWCAVYVDDGNGRCQLLAVAHVDPDKEQWARELDRRYPPDPHATDGVANVMRTGRPEAIYEGADALIAATARDGEEIRLLRELGVHSRLIVPLRARGRTLGAIAFVAATPTRTYGPDDLALAEQLSNAAGLAVDNARLYHEAQEANRLKDEFLATVSHELRTPLNAMLGWARLLRAGTMAPTMSERALVTIERNAQAQAQLIDDLLDVSRIITGKLRLDVRSIDLGAVIESAVDAVRPAADAKQIRLDVDIDRMIGPVTADGARFEQVVWNLLSNAVKFTPAGGGVSVALTSVGSHLELRVTDSGQGIRPDFLPHVFDRFRQADNRGTKSHTGLGLGLAIVRHLVELHGGTVRAESAGEGKGASFTVDIPLAPVHRADTPSPAGAGMRSVQVPMLDGVRILVVDDEADGRELLAIVLEQLGAEVQAVGTADEALAVFNEWRPSVLLSDIGMPGEDGYSLIRRVRALPPAQGGNVPAAALTAYARAEDRTRALLAGFQQHVAKPVEPKELAAVVANLAGRTGSNA